jgi:hypothetical protein
MAASPIAPGPGERGAPDPVPLQGSRSTYPTLEGRFRLIDRNRRPVVLAMTVIVLAAILVPGYAGFAPWSMSMPFFKATDSSSSTSVSFSQARAAAGNAVMVLPGGPWSPIFAVGFDLRAPLAMPGPNYPNSTPYPGGCSWTLGGGGNLSEMSLPASDGRSAPGFSPAWVVLFRDAIGGLAIVKVVDGQAAVYAWTSPGPCSQQLADYSPISPAVIDSPQAASIADTWGGSAFLANYSDASSILTIHGDVAFMGGTIVGPPSGGGPPPNGSNGSSPPPPPPPPPFMVQNYTIPSSWLVSYATCSMIGPCPHQAQWFSANLGALNGTVLSVNVYASGSSGYFGYPFIGLFGMPWMIRGPPIGAP